MATTVFEVFLQTPGGQTARCILARLNGPSAAELGIVVERALVGTFVSSLDMAGVSLSVMHVDSELLALLDSDAEAPGWPAHVYKPELDKHLLPVPLAASMMCGEAGGAGGLEERNPGAVREAVQRCAQACVDAEAELNHYDAQVLVSTSCSLRADTAGVCLHVPGCQCCEQRPHECSAVHFTDSHRTLSSRDCDNFLGAQVGDGDCGTTVRAGGEAVLARLPDLDCARPAACAAALSSAVANGMGGTSGALYQIFLTAAAGSLRNSGAASASAAEYAAAFAAGVAAIQRHGKAQEGDRSMVDALAPAAAAAASAAPGVRSPLFSDQGT
jgi:triose/dihydroxyacetone kinase / FAD-AMP lyase (cyclizing)